MRVELLELIPRAFQIAASGRPGPVLLDHPGKTCRNAVVEFDEWPEPGRPVPSRLLEPASVSARRAHDRLRRKARAVHLGWGGALGGFRGGAEVLALAEKSSIPAVTTLMGLGAIPSDHPLSLGMMGMHGARSTEHGSWKCRPAHRRGGALRRPRHREAR